MIPAGRSAETSARAERGEDGVQGFADDRRIREADDLDGAGDGRRLCEDDAGPTPPRRAEQDVQCGAVDEDDPVQVEDEKRGLACGELPNTILELAGVRQVELARHGDVQQVGILGFLVLELERGHWRWLRIRNAWRARFENGERGHLQAVSASPEPAPDLFAHPVERELARVFDEHGIRWLYEPHTFVLERAPDGSVREAFTPDFFLPDLGLYVECTVMRQALTNRKRRKALKARATRGVTVEILFRRDFERLARRWKLPALERATRPPQAA